MHHTGAQPHLDVIVEDEQLSLAIGKRGQNVRLAAELIGCRIDIKSETDVKDEVADALARMLQTAFAGAAPAPGLDEEIDLTTVPGVGPRTANLLNEAGYTTLRSLVEAQPEALQQVEGVGPKTAISIWNWAKDRAEKLEQRESAGEVAEAGGEAQPMPQLSQPSMNDQDFMAALSRAFKESEEKARATDDAVEGAAEETKGEGQ